MGAIISAFAGWLIKTVVIKFVIFTVLFLVISSIVPILLDTIMPDYASDGDGGIEAAWNALPAEMGYYLNLTLVPTGLSMVISAYIARFILRRIPLIG